MLGRPTQQTNELKAIDHAEQEKVVRHQPDPRSTPFSFRLLRSNLVSFPALKPPCRDVPHVCV